MSSVPYQPILGSLGYILSKDKQQVLMVHRNARGSDHHFEKYSGLGGKMEPDEDIATCMKREIWEEAGVTCEKISLRGTINWTGFGPVGEDWMGFVFLIEEYDGTPYKQNPEGELEWHSIQSLNQLPMWEGDQFFLPLVFDKDPKIFHGYMPYKDGKPQSWAYTRL